MPAYDAERFDPPAPLAHVTLRNLETGAVWSDVPMLIDSGADVTLIPRTVLDRLALVTDPDRRYELRGFDDSVSYAPIVRLELRFCRRSSRGQFLLIDQGIGVLGRNVMNAVPLLLDGPGLTWDEYRRISGS